MRKAKHVAYRVLLIFIILSVFIFEFSIDRPQRKYTTRVIVIRSE